MLRPSIWGRFFAADQRDMGCLERETLDPDRFGLVYASWAGQPQWSAYTSTSRRPQPDIASAAER